MRVLHVGKYYPPYPGGIEVFVSDLATQQQRAGLQPAVLVHSSPGSTLPEKPSEFPVIEARTWGTMAYTPVSPGFGWRLHTAIRRLKPDLLHLHLPNVSAFWALALPAARKLPWVAHWHSDVLTADAPGKIRAAYVGYQYFEAALLRRCEKVIATSENYRTSSPALKRFQAKSTVAPLGLDPQRYGPPSPEDQSWAEGLFGTGFRVLGLGRLSHYKGFNVLVEAMEYVDEASCVIAGDGEQAQALTTQVESSRGVQRVNLCGSVTDGQARALMTAADVIVMPSLQRTEAFGLVLLEAMIAGKPVIASQIKGSGMPWVVAQGGHGVVTQPGDSAALSHALNTLKNNASKRKRLGETGRESFDRYFHIRSVEREIAEIYNSVLS